MIFLNEIHTLDMTEDDKDRSWKCIKVLNYSEEKGVDGITSFIFFVERNDMNKLRSYV
jgi:hypothetical protein